MTDRPPHKPAWIRFLIGAMTTVACAALVVWWAGSYGRSIAFAFGVNWVLAAWAITLGLTVTPLRLPAQYYNARPFEKGGRIYDYLGVRWYRRLLRPVLWTVKPALLRSRPGARETMIQGTYDAETGHLLILVLITGITGWALTRGWWDTAGWLLLFNLLHNGYPLLSMRQLRARLVTSSTRPPARAAGGIERARVRG
jgi:hypothetical protein